MAIVVDSNFDAPTVESAIQQILTEEFTAAVASCNASDPTVCTVYFAHDNNDVWFTSQESTNHIQVLRENPSIAMGIWHRPAQWGEPIYGLQLFGTATEVGSVAEAQQGLAVLNNRFAGTRDIFPDVNAVFGAKRKSCLVQAKIHGGTLVDEKSFGPRQFINFSWQTRAA